MKYILPLIFLIGCNSELKDKPEIPLVQDVVTIIVPSKPDLKEAKELEISKFVIQALNSNPEITGYSNDSTHYTTYKTLTLKIDNTKIEIKLTVPKSQDAVE